MVLLKTWFRSAPWACLSVGLAALAAASLYLAIWTRHDLAVLYAIPLAIAALHVSPRGVQAITVLAVGLDIVAAYFDMLPLDLAIVGLIALLVVSYLEGQLSLQRLELARRTQEAEDSRRELQEFMGMVVHDLRSPLTVVHGYSQLARHRLSEGNGGAVWPALEAIDSGADRMQRLVGDLHDATRIGAGRFDVRPEIVDLGALVRQIGEEQRSTSSKHQIRLDAPEHLLGFWDRERITQVFANLISNALKYSPEGGEVSITIRQTDGSALACVADNGMGIAPEEVEGLFRPFSRVGESRKVDGTGLGLYITKGIVEAHAGRIWVVSTLGQGSTFFVELPIGNSFPMETPRSEASLKRFG